MREPNTRDEILACHLAAGKPVKAAARAAGVSTVTVWRRMKSPVFRERVAELRRAIVAEVVRRLAAEGIG